MADENKILDEIFNAPTQSVSLDDKDTAELDSIFSGGGQMVQNQPKINPLQDVYNDYPQRLQNDILAQAGVAGAGMLARAGIAKYRQPWSERNIALQDVMKTQQQLGLEQGGQVSKIVPTIKQQTTDINKRYGGLIKDSRQKTQIGLDVLNRRATNLKNTILDPSIDDLAMTIKSGYPQFKTDTYAGWKSGMDAAEQFMVDRNISFSGKDFNTKVIDRTITQAKSAGLEDNAISALKNLGKDNLGIKETSAYIRNTLKELPTDVQFKLRENWADFLEVNAPKEVKTQIEGLNRNYKTFKELEAGLGVNTRTGVFNDEKLYKQLSTYSKRQQDLSTQNALKILSDGTDLSAPIKGVKGKVGNLETLKQAKTKLDNSISKASASEKIRLRGIRQKLDVELKNVMDWKSAQSKIDRLKIAQKRVNARSIGAKISQENIFGLRVPRPVQNIAKIGGKVIPIMGVAPQLLQAGQMAGEFDKWRQQGGFLATDPMGGTEQISPDDIEKMMKYGLIG